MLRVDSAMADMLLPSTNEIPFEIAERRRAPAGEPSSPVVAGSFVLSPFLARESCLSIVDAASTLLLLPAWMVVPGTLGILARYGPAWTLDYLAVRQPSLIAVVCAG